MRITTQGDYALRCLLHIACQSEKGAVPISRIVEEEGLPQDYIEQLLMKMRRHRLIKSVRGVNGGYLLEKDIASITVKDVLVAVEGEAFEVICSRNKDSRKKSCHRDTCVLKDVWVDLKSMIEKHLDKISLKDLVAKKQRRCP
jgi:Rrf2 family transcriptional regulator, cysteine metabolism repressor